MKKTVCFLMILLSIIMYHVISFSAENEEDSISLNVSNSEIKIEDEFSFSLNLANTKVAAFNLTIFFNNELLEYVSGPENTNVIGSKIITVWYDETGGQNPKQNCELVKYTFKAKDIGNEYIAIQGEFYDADGNEIQTYTDGIEMISNEGTQTEMIEVSEESQVTSDNSKLQILRLNHEGMSPVFSPDITEYYFLTEDLTSLEVTAIPANANAEVSVTGNTNFKEGLNTINIMVISPDKTSKTEYVIYVTKTKDVEKANANLETLAIENVTLEPEFANDIYQYQTTVSNTTENLNILAIPEKPTASVEVTGGENLQIGNNEINIKVVAENGYTTKQFKINVYRRNEEEQRMIDEEQQVNIQKLNAILENQEEANEEDKQSQNESNMLENIKENIWFIVIYIVFALIIIILVIYRIRKGKKGKNEKESK